MNLPRRTINTVDLKSRNTWYMLGSVLLIVAAFLIYTSRDINVTLNQGNMKIEGIFSATITYSEISQMDTVAVMPEIESKTGFAFAGHYKGYFQLQGLGKTEIFVNMNHPPFIHIEMKDGEIFYLNHSDPEKTRQLYNELQVKVAVNK